MHLKHERIWVANGGGIIMFYWSEKHDFVNVGKSGNISNFILEWGQTRKYASNSIENCSSLTRNIPIIPLYYFWKWELYAVNYFKTFRM